MKTTKLREPCMLFIAIFVDRRFHKTYSRIKIEAKEEEKERREGEDKSTDVLTSQLSSNFSAIKASSHDKSCLTENAGIQKP